MKKLTLLTCGLLASAATYAQSNENIENLLKKLPKISGYVQIGYQWSDNAANDESTFNIRRARVAISGELMPKFADYKVQAELSFNEKMIVKNMKKQFQDKLYTIIDTAGAPFSHPLSPRARVWAVGKLENID